MTFTTPDVGTQLQKFNPTDTAIATMAEQYMPLTITGVNDIAGFRRVHEARMLVKNHRVEVEKVRKALKQDSLDYGRRVDAEAKRITALLEPIEKHLSDEEQRIEDEKSRIKNAARIEAEKKEAERKAAEAAKLKEEQDRLAAERAAFEKERAAAEAERKAAQDKIDAENRKIEAEKLRLAKIEEDRKRAEWVENEKKIAAEKAARETEARMKREAEEKAAADKAKAEAAEAARIRAEQLRPDKEKLLAVAAAVEAIKVPTVSLPMTRAADRVFDILTDAAARITAVAEGLSEY